MKILTEKEYYEIIARLDKLEKEVKENQKFPQEVFYDNQELIRVMHISKRTSQNWRNNNIISYSQVEGKIYYKHSDVLEMLDKNHNPASKKNEPMDASH